MSNQSSRSIGAIAPPFRELRGRKVLVVGSYPPPFDSSSRLTLSVASKLLKEGALVEVLSSSLRSAAHLRQRLDGWRGCIALWRLASGYDALVLRLEEGLFLQAKGRIAHLLESLLLSMALRRWRLVLLQLDSPLTMPGGVGGRSGKLIWKRARWIVVLDDESRMVVIRDAKLPQEKVHLLSIEPGHERAETEGIFVHDRESAMALIKARARLDREISEAFFGKFPDDRARAKQTARAKWPSWEVTV